MVKNRWVPLVWMGSIPCTMAIYSSKRPPMALATCAQPDRRARPGRLWTLAVSFGETRPWKAAASRFTFSFARSWPDLALMLRQWRRCRVSHWAWQATNVGVFKAGVRQLEPNENCQTCGSNWPGGRVQVGPDRAAHGAVQVHREGFGDAWRAATHDVLAQGAWSNMSMMRIKLQGANHSGSDNYSFIFKYLLELDRTFLVMASLICYCNLARCHACSQQRSIADAGGNLKLVGPTRSQRSTN